MKKTLLILLVVMMIFAVGCREKKIVHCDICSIEIKINADSKMNDDWSIFCTECNEEYSPESGNLDLIEDSELSFN